DEGCQPFVGRTTNSWRASQARNRCRPDECGEVYASEATTTISGLEDILGQPCRWNRSDGPVRGTDDLLPTLVRSADFASRSTPDHMVRGDQAPDCRVDCASTCRSPRVAGFRRSRSWTAGRGARNMLTTPRGIVFSNRELSGGRIIT